MQGHKGILHPRPHREGVGKLDGLLPGVRHARGFLCIKTEELVLAAKRLSEMGIPEVVPPAAQRTHNITQGRRTGGAGLGLAARKAGWLAGWRMERRGEWKGEGQRVRHALHNHDGPMSSHDGYIPAAERNR